MAVEEYAEEEMLQLSMSFEGIPISTQRLTVGAFQIIPAEPMRQFDQIEFRGKATILEITHRGDSKDQTSRRIYVAVVDAAAITEVHPR